MVPSAEQAPGAKPALSLRWRLTLTLIGGAAILAALLYVALRAYAVQIAQQSQDRILEASASSVLDSAALRGEAIVLDLPYAAFAMLDTAADDRVFYAVHQDGRFLTGYEDLTPRTNAPLNTPRFDTLSYRGTDIRRIEMTRVFPASPAPIVLSVTIAQTRDSLAGTLLQISLNAALFGAAFFVLAAGLSLWTGSSTVTPLRRLAASVGRRGPRDLRPMTGQVPAELTPLVGALNTLMTRLDQSLSQSEDFIAEAAHRVRTPLATVRSHAETTLQKVDRDENRQALRAMIRAIDESSRAAGQLLDHAMVTFRGEHLEQQAIDLAATCDDIAGRLAPVAEMKDIDLVLKTQTPAHMQGDPILIENALRNLIDNALKYSPSERAVEITVSAEPRATVSVKDRGPGFPPGQMGTLSDRFQRGENALGTVGSGLGLTIVRDVVEAHGGSLVLRNRREGGACVTLSF
ncbi:sensor histidine kinase [Primorskyibacter sp. S187A]|uniref:sensor histidine kinase n=1 Tax=Primorskyibacter sp. S187A TaxID=3415130 RepID=UPI003C799E16